MSGAKSNLDSSCSIVIKSSPIQGKGIFARSRLPRGRKIAYFEGYETDQDTRYSLLLDGRPIEPTGELKYLNHSCNPNAYFRDRWLVASRDIYIGEEITIDYFATENMVSYPFICNCGAENCRDKKKMARTATPLNINNNVVHSL
jgi:hypothetical protein